MITSRDKRMYFLAEKVAALSLYKHKHGAVIVDGDRIISLGCNRAVSHPRSFKFFKGTIHAEQRALILSKQSVEGMTLYSARIGGNQNSRPCPLCMSYIKEAGIRKIVYLQDGKLIEERV